MRSIVFVFLLFLLACTAETAVEPVIEPSATTVSPTATVMIEAVEPTAVPTQPPAPTNEPEPAKPTALPPTAPPPTAVPEATTTAVGFGRTPEGAFYHGAADAPVTLIDYSDFL